VGLVSLGWDGSNYLAVWQADGPPIAARISSGGALLDPNGIRLSTSAASPYGRPAISTGGGSTLIAWEDLRRGQSDIFGARLAADGTVLDPGGVALSTAAGPKHFPTAAWTGSAHLLLWETWPPGSAVVGVYVGSDGTVLSPGSFAVTSSAANPAVASLPGTSLVAYDSSGAQCRARILSTSTPPDAGVADAQVADASAPDASAFADAAAPDATSAADAAMVDSGALGGPDAAVDGGAPSTGASEHGGAASGGCGCRTSGTPDEGALLLLLAIAPLLRRDRSRGRARRI
jgi:MYXO-CTERM domain-containing protein